MIETKSPTIQLDGSHGEGGGQILRSALSLSALTGTPFRLEKIRAGRKRPGLMRQHLTCVRAAAALCDAELSRVEVGTSELEFTPGAIHADHGTYAIGTAGAMTLLLQTLLPILLRAPGRSEVTLQGGSHVMAAPSTDYIDRVFLPKLAEMGARVSVELVRPGFYPAGGGELRLIVDPLASLEPQRWDERLGEHATLHAEVLTTPDIPEHVVRRELSVARRLLSIRDSNTSGRVVERTACPGNVVNLTASFGKVIHTMTVSRGERGKRAQQVAKEAVWEMQRYLAAPAPVDEYLADQLLLPLALAGGGGFTSVALTPHFHSNVEVIEAFLPVCIRTESKARFAERVTIEAKI